MPLSPPHESVAYTTTLHSSSGRLPGSYHQEYSSGLMSWDEVWYTRDRSWVRAPKGQRHLTHPYSVYIYQAEPPKQYRYTWTRWDWYSPGREDYCYMQGDLAITGDIRGWLAANVLVSELDELLILAQNSVLKQAAGTTFNSALFVAEANKTLDLLMTNARKIARSFREIKRGRVLGQPLKETIRRAMSALGLIHSKRWDPRASYASQWLEYRYGVETLVMDVRDAAEYAASKASDQPERYSWRSTKRRASAVVNDIPDGWGLLAPVYQSGIVKNPGRAFQKAYKAKAWLTAELETTGYRTLQQLGFANPVGLMWELIPLSFAVDWALGIGKYLELQSSLWGLKVLDAGISLQCDGYVEVTAVTADPGGLFWSPSWSGASSRSFKAMRYQRWVWENPSPTYRLGSGLNVKRAADAAALLYNFAHR